jgi:parvulin-like peptidyl-prolyl isomerase
MSYPDRVDDKDLDRKDAESPLAAPIKDEAVNANTDYWAEWQTKRDERRKLHLIERGVIEDPNGAGAGKGRRHTGIWPKFWPGGRSAASSPQSRTPDPPATSVPDPANPASGARRASKQQAEIQVKWSAEVASATPDEQIEVRVESPAPDAETQRPPPAPAPKIEDLAPAIPIAEMETPLMSAAVAEVETPTSRVAAAEVETPAGPVPAGQDVTPHQDRKSPVTHSASNKRQVISLLRTRKRFFVLFVFLFAAGVVIGGAVATLHFGGDRNVLTINGKRIPQSEYLRRLEIDGGQAALMRVITEEELLQFGAQQGLMPSVPQVRARIAEMRSKPDFQQFLTDRRLTPFDLERQARIELTSDALTTQGITVSDAELRRFYEANISGTDPRAAFYTPQTARISIIVTHDRASGEKAIRELRRGASFESVAKTYSTDVSRSTGGLMPPVRRGRTRFGQLPGIDRAVFGMKPGDVVGPIRLLNVWAVMRCNGMAPASAKPYEAVKEECRKALLMRKGMRGNAAKLQAEFTAFQKKTNLIVMRAP